MSKNWVLVLGCVAMVVASAQAQTQRKSISGVVLPLIKLSPKDLPFAGAKLVDEQVTCSVSPCTVTAKVRQGTGADGSVLCSVSVPSAINVTNFTGPKPRFIVWSLDTTEVDAAYTVGFENTYGILVLSDSNEQLKKGGIGDEGANPSSNKFFHFKNAYAKKQIASYLPIVLQTAPGGKVSMCAAIDPVIVNKD